MLRTLLHSIRSLFLSTGTSAARISCYHCGEKSTPARTVYVLFDGSTRAVCCHGCAAILKAVEEMDMREEYLAQKTRLS